MAAPRVLVMEPIYLSMVQRIVAFVKWAALIAIGVPLGVAIAPYAIGPVYRFPTPAPFSGTALYNPYADAPVGAHWRTANFHAHGRAWGGLTEGRQTDSAIVDYYYNKLGYDIAGVSDYLHIDHHRTDSSFVPVYEHGVNALKTHLLGINARHVVWFDFPLPQSRSEKQYVIDRVAGDASLVALAHPALRGGYSRDDLAYLTHYQLFEVLNHFVVSDSLWDVALSTGHAVWAIGSDDSHNITDAGQTGAMWTEILTPSTRAADVVEALKAGRTYAVAGHHARSDAHPEQIAVRGDTLTVTCEGPESRIDFIGQGGRLLARAFGVESASYVIQPGDPYVRTVISTPHTLMFLNPIVRYDGKKVARPVAMLDGPKTWALRSSILVTAVMLIWLALARRRFALRRRLRPEPALA
jgi:hypothetical protein